MPTWSDFHAKEGAVAGRVWNAGFTYPDTVRRMRESRIAEALLATLPPGMSLDGGRTNETIERSRRLP